MSRTDAHRPVWVRLNDRRGDVVAVHLCERSAGADCDLPPWPVDQRHRDTHCYYRPVGELRERAYRGSYVWPRSRRPFRRAWFGSERTAQRAVLRSLTRDANSSGEIDEDRIDHRQTHRYAEYGGGWWD